MSKQKRVGAGPDLPAMTDRPTIKCLYCAGSGEIGRRTTSHSYVAPGPVPDDARGVYGEECPRCSGEGRFLVSTAFVHPPIPPRQFDWSATLDGYEPGDPIGRGKTEAEAIADLEGQLDD